MYDLDHVPEFFKRNPEVVNGGGLGRIDLTVDLVRP
jgi:hypothetical protein